MPHTIRRFETHDLRFPTSQQLDGSDAMEGRVTEYSDHLHEHVVHPVTMKNGHYRPPKDFGYSVEFTEDAINRFCG